MSILTWSCDTASNIEPPDDSFFTKFYGNEGDQEGVDAVVNPDGTITLFGTTEEVNFGKQLYLVNIQSNGLINWERTYGADKNEIAKDIILTNDNRLALVADIENTSTEHDILVLTLSLDGGILASDTISYNNGTSPTDETANSITQISDGFIVAGSTNNLDVKPGGASGPVNDTRDALFVRLFDDLTVYPSIWKEALGPGSFDEAIKVVEFSPNLFYMFTNSDKPNLDGDINFNIIGLGSTGEGNAANDFLLGQAGSNETLSTVAFSPVESGEGFLLAGISQTPGSSADIYIVKLRKDLNFNSSDIQVQKTLAIDLGIVSQAKVSAVASAGSGFYILANDKSTGAQNFYLTKIDNSGFVVWDDAVIFGGEGDDSIGSVLELPDGSIGIIGTFAVGRDGETKMTFIKVNKEGKFKE
ncbi:MAG: hypothetical protein ABJH04_12650 [Cyclobacteriaceae bacterium]